MKSNSDQIYCFIINDTVYIFPKHQPFFSHTETLLKAQKVSIVKSYHNNTLVTN